MRRARLACRLGSRSSPNADFTLLDNPQTAKQWSGGEQRDGSLQQGNLLWLGLFLQAKDDEAAMLVWRILADIRKVQVRRDEDRVFLAADSDDFGIGRAAQVLLEDRKGIMRPAC
jgi:hypothetical protein